MKPLTEQLRLAGSFLAAFGSVQAQTNSSDSSVSGPPFDYDLYTSSPPVYPSPNATGIDWEAAFNQAKSFVGQLTLDEKAQLVTGTAGPCVGNIGPIERLNFSGLCLQDGPLAIREATYASVYPAGLTVAASWDRRLAKQRGVDMGKEFHDKGAHVALGPVAGPLGRSGYGGRNWEGFSPDPYLTGLLFEDTIIGMQSSGVQSCAKHYIAYEQETQRNPSINPEGITIESVSSNLDDRTMHELYLWPFYNAVRGGASSIMCSYNRINGSYGCENSKTLNGLLKEELGFQGYVVSDWGGTHSGYPSVNAGLDMDMPGGIAFTETAHSYFGKNITQSVNNGSLALSRLDDMCMRIMTPYFRLKQQTNYPPIDPEGGQLNFFPETAYLFNYTFGPANVDVRENHAHLIRELGAAGVVLLKNDNNTLPFKTAPRNIAVFGNDAADLTDGLYPQDDSSIGVLPVGGGSGTGRMTYAVSPLEAIKSWAAREHPRSLVQYVTNNSLINEGQGWSQIAPSPPDVCFVFLNTWATEGEDRTSLDVDQDGNGVVDTIASQCSNTVVITHSGGLNVLPWSSHPNVTAILAAHYGGQEVGNSIVDVLSGAVNPSGRLPYTIAHNISDYSFADIANLSSWVNTSDPNAWQSNFTERLLIDYRHFDATNSSVNFPFGYGLSYTNFSMSGLSVDRTCNGSITALPPPQRVVPGGNPSLWEVLYTAHAKITNTGKVAGAAVPQLYLNIPSDNDPDTTPPKQLRGFDKVSLQPGESATVAFPLTRRDMSYWDRTAQQWRIGEGETMVMAGWSSRDIVAQTTLTAMD